MFILLLKLILTFRINLYVYRSLHNNYKGVLYENHAISVS